MTVETRTAPAVPGRLTLRLAAALLMEEGVLPSRAAKKRAYSVRSGSNRDPGDMVNEAFRPLVADGVVKRIGDVWYAHDLGDLAAWIADGVDAREDAGVAMNPAVPGQRAAV